MSLTMMQVLAGAFGGLVRGLVGITKSQTLPPTQPFQWKYLMLSIAVAVLSGLMAGVVINSDWRTSLLAGYAGADLLENLYKLKFANLLKAP